VAKLHTRRIEGDCAGLFDDLFDFRRRDEQELGLIVYETGNQPGTGNAVHVDVGTGDPEHGFLLHKN
jgi:hypothetical protein